MRLKKIVDDGKAAIDKFLSARRGEAKAEPEEEDIVSIVQAAWTAFDSGTNRDDLERAATGWAFVNGLQNRYWYQRNIREDIIPSEDGQPAKNRDSWNLLRDYYLQWAGQIKAGLPTYRCEALSDYDAQTSETARMINALFRYHYDYVWRFDTAAYSQLIPYLFKSNPAYILYYPGRPDNLGAPGAQPKTVVHQIILPSFSVVPIGDYNQSLRECSGVIAELVLPVRKVMEMFPGKAQDILKYVKDNDVKPMGFSRLYNYLAPYGIEPAPPAGGLCIEDRELIWSIVFQRAGEKYPKGRMYLILNSELLAHQPLWGGVMPIEQVRVVEKEPGRPIGLSPAFEGVSSQIAFNDIFGALRKKAYREANPDRFVFEDTLLSDDGKSMSNGIELGDGRTRVLRVNRDLVAMGVSPKDQVPFAEQPASSGIAPEILGLARTVLQSTMHINAEMTYEVLTGTPAELLKTMFTIGEKKLTPAQKMMENCIFSAWMTAMTIMQDVLDDGDCFTIVNSGRTETYKWKKENLTEGVNHSFISNIGVPTTKEAKLKYFAMIAQLFPQITQNLDPEDLAILADLDGLGIRGGRNPEIELAEEINRKIQNGELEKVEDKASGEQWVVKGYELRPEWDCKLHLKVLSRLFTSKVWQTLDDRQKEAAYTHAGDLMVMQWLKDNKQAGLFGQLPPAEFDIQMWESRGVEIPENIKQLMRITGRSYLQVTADLGPEAIPQAVAGKEATEELTELTELTEPTEPTEPTELTEPTEPTEPTDTLITEPETEITTEPTTEPTTNLESEDELRET